MWSEMHWAGWAGLGWARRTHALDCTACLILAAAWRVAAPLSSRSLTTSLRTSSSVPSSPTATLVEKISRCCDWLRSRKYDALGTATFGPDDLSPNSPTIGYVTTTPKPGWKNIDIVGCSVRCTGEAHSRHVEEREVDRGG